MDIQFNRNLDYPYSDKTGPTCTISGPTWLNIWLVWSIFPHRAHFVVEVDVYLLVLGTDVKSPRWLQLHRSVCKMIMAVFSLCLVALLFFTFAVFLSLLFTLEQRMWDTFQNANLEVRWNRPMRKHPGRDKILVFVPGSRRGCKLDCVVQCFMTDHVWASAFSMCFCQVK